MDRVGIENESVKINRFTIFSFAILTALFIFFPAIRLFANACFRGSISSINLGHSGSAWVAGVVHVDEV